MRGEWEARNKNSSLKLIILTKFLPVTFQTSWMILLEKENKSYPRLCSTRGNSGAHPEWRSPAPQVPSVLPLTCWCISSSCWDAQCMKPYCHFGSHSLKPSWSQVPSIWPLEYSVTPTTLHSLYMSQQYF